MSESSNTHAYTRVDFLNRACTRGLAINSIGIKAEGLERGNEWVSSKMAEIEKEKEAALCKITQLEREGEAALAKIHKLKNEKECTENKVDLLEREKEAALSKIVVLEKEKEYAARKIALLEKELKTKEYIFGQYTNAQLQKEKKLRTKFVDFKRHTNTEREKEKEATLSKIAVLEKELETMEVRMYKQAIRAIKQIYAEDKEPKEKVKELTITVQKITKERNYWENLAKQLKDKESDTTELVEARKEMIMILSDMCYGDMDIGIKRFGVIDSSSFHSACKQKFSHQVAEEKATELCSIWQTAVENPQWNPFRTITSNGEVRAEMIDQEDKHLQQLRKEWGYEVYLAVAIALKEIKEYNMKVRTTTHQLWNFKEGRKATLKEAIWLIGKKLKEAKIKDTTGFVKVDELKPGIAGKNLIVKVLTTDVVVDKNQNNRWQSQSPCVYSKPQITRVAESLVGDETGTIIFTARNGQVDLMKPGSILLLYGAKNQMHRGFMRLAVEHRIQIIIAEPVEFVVNEDDDCNMSLDEYEVIRKY